jgi:DNA-binding NtrC family response regulator
MKYPQLLVYETDGKLAAGLQALCAKRGVRLRELRHAQACLRTLRRHGPGVLVLKLGRDLEKELTLLERVAWLFPDAVCIVIGDHPNPALAGLVWDLGARYVLFPPQPVELLPELVDGFLPSANVPSAEK